MEIWLGPQERLIKRVTDAVYSSRSDVRILTNELADGGLAKALQAKSADGFDVQVVVGAALRHHQRRPAHGAHGRHPRRVLVPGE